MSHTGVGVLGLGRLGAVWRAMGPAGRSSVVFTAAVVAGNLFQVVWLIGGVRALPGGHFGTVLAAQALYGVLQMIADNGTGLMGARWSARGELGDARRREVARARTLLAGVCVVVGLAIAAAGGPDLLEAFIPFAVALMLFSVLNVWERYGRGDVRPYASYLLLRSLLVGALAGTVALAGGELPLFAVGACEVAAIVLVGVGCSAWALPRGGVRVSASVWRTVRDIGLPAVLTHYNLAVGTVLLAVAGETSAAAVCGVAFRLLLGVQGLNGAMGSAVFPLLARSEPGAAHGQASRLAAAAGLMLAGAALIVMAVVAAPVVHVLLDREGAVEEAAVILGIGAAGATGVVMHRSFALVAGTQERLLRSASACGALVVTSGAVVALFVGGPSSALVVLAAFLAGQVVVLSIIGSAGAGADRALTLVAVAVLPLAAGVMAASESARFPLAVAGLVLGSLVAARWHRGTRPGGREPTVGGAEG